MNEMRTPSHCPVAKNRGFGILEMVVGAAVLSTALLAISSFYQNALVVSRMTTTFVQANYLLEEGTEAVKLMRDKSWSANIKNLAVGVPYHLAYSGGMWSSTTTTALVDGLFDRTFVLGTVYRDANYNIISSGGSVDAGTVMLTTSVAWRSSTGTTTKSLSTYVTNIFNN